MKGWLMDAYRNKNRIVLWIKTPDKNLRLVKRYHSSIYIEHCREAEEFIKKNHLPHYLVRRQNYLRNWILVYEVFVPDLESYERFVRWIENETCHQVNLYNADIPPEQMYLYERELSPGQPVEIRGTTIVPLHQDDAPIPLKKVELEFKRKDFAPDSPIIQITANDKKFEGEEKDILRKFAIYLAQTNPDVISAYSAFRKIPYLSARYDFHKLACPFHRWDALPLKYKGGKSYYSYGRIHYQDYAIRLRGRFLVDLLSFTGGECEAEAIMELCQITGTRFQQLASRSFGAAFHSYLVKVFIEHDLLVPYKEKPIERPMSLLDLIKADRVGHTYDPKIGFHTNVAELDFASMFPWIMHNFNISADTLMCDKPPFSYVPELPIRISQHHKGLIPKAILPFIERRMYYKQHPSAVNKVRAAGLKWVLVSSYGYLRFREFKLGIARSHMAVGAYAREILLKSAQAAEDKGYELIHGIVDSLYIKKRNMTEEAVQAFAKEIGQLTGIPMSFEGIFKWIVFLPSINDSSRPLPSRYFGVFKNGEIKARGIELRQAGASKLVKYFQQKIIERMAKCDEKKEIIELVPAFCKILRETIEMLPATPAQWLVIKVCASKTEYAANIPQKKIIAQIKEKDLDIKRGQYLAFIYQDDGPVLPEDYNGKPDIARYQKLLTRALYVLLQPFGITKEQIAALAGAERQTKIRDYCPHIFIAAKPPYDNVRTIFNHGEPKGSGETIQRNSAKGIQTQLQRISNTATADNHQ